MISIGVYLKYASEPTQPYDDYIFTFGLDAKKELNTLNGASEKVFIALVCVKDRQICCISYKEFDNWIKKTSTETGKRRENFNNPR